jgi:PAS domain S-box-containing protein
MSELQPLRVLIAEDRPDDAELLVRELRRSGYAPTWQRVDTEESLAAALRAESWDLVICDYFMPHLTVAVALRTVRALADDLPFLIASGSVGEDLAVETLKAGASDFFLKDNLRRLPSAIDRELREARVRREGRQAALRLHDSEERLRALFDQAIVGIAQIDCVGRLLFVNDRYCEIVGRTREALIGLHVSELVEPEQAPECSERFERAVAQGIPYVAEERYPRPDGSDVWVRNSVSRLCADGSTPIGVVSVVQDISEQHRAVDALRASEQSLREALEARDEFLSIASHELRTPLTPLVIQLHLLETELEAQHKAEGGPDLHKRLRVIDRQIERLQRLIAELLDISRIIGGRLRLELEPVDLAEIVREVVAGLQEHGDAERAGSQIELELASGAVGRWDRMRLEQVVSQLLSNALKYGAGKPIHVQLVQADGDAELRVRDQGIGIAPQDQARIFGRFERAVSARHYGGLGLGLFIARQIAEALGGEIGVDSAPGRGASFRVRLPLAGPAAPAGASS